MLGARSLLHRFAASLGPLSCAIAPAIVGCAPESEIELVGTRADGLTVVCSPEDEHGRYACDPQPPRGSEKTSKRSSGVEDACASWVRGGAALVLWPPNHRLERVTLYDCARVRAACNDAVAIARAGRVVAVTSDEPLDALGDGDTAAGDLGTVGSQEVLLRSERQGGGDGRVYRIESEDDDGHRETCEVHVPHDRGPYGGAEDSGEAVRVVPAP